MQATLAAEYDSKGEIFNQINGIGIVVDPIIWIVQF